MTEQEIRRAQDRCGEFGTLPQYSASAAVQFAKFACDPSTGYAATLRALLEARELLRRIEAEKPTYELGHLLAEVRAFLAEGESK